VIRFRVPGLVGPGVSPGMGGGPGDPVRYRFLPAVIVPFSDGREFNGIFFPFFVL